VEDLKAERQAAAAMLSELKPRTAIEAAYAARAVTMFHASMECFRKAATPGINLSLAARFIGQGNALSRQSDQMINLLNQEKQANQPRMPASGMEQVLMKAGADVLARQAPKAQPAAATADAKPGAGAVAAAAGAAGTNARQDPMTREQAPATKPPAAAAAQKPMHQSAAAPHAPQPAAAPAVPAVPAKGFMLTQKEIDALNEISAFLKSATA